MERIAYILLLAILIWSPLAFGAVHAVSETIMCLAVFTASVLLATQSIVKDRKTGVRQFQCPATSFNLIFLLFFFYLLFQIIPLPESVVKFLSSEAVIVARKSSPASLAAISSPATGKWFSISAYSNPVRQSLILWVTYGLFFLAFTRVLNTRKRIETAAMAILILGCFETIYGMSQTFTGSDHIWWYRKPFHGSVTGTYVNRNHFAGLMEMVMILALLYAAALSERKKTNGSPPIRKRYVRARVSALLSGEQRFNKMNFVLFSGVVTGVGLIFSGSRGGMISAAAAILAAAVLFIIRKSHRRKGIIVLIALAIISIYAGPMGAEKVLYGFDFTQKDMETRERFWQETVRMWHNYPQVGSGIGTFQYVFPKYQSSSDTKKFVESAHNDWLQFLAEAGVVGILLLLGGIAFYFFHEIKTWKRRHNAFSVCLGIAPIAVFVTMAIHSLTDFNLRVPANFLMLTAICAIGYSAVQIENPRQTERRNVRHRSVPFRYKGVIVLSLFVCTVFWGGFWSVRRAVGESIYLSALSYLSDDPGKAVSSLEKAAAWDPTSSEYQYKFSLALQKLRHAELTKSQNDQASGEVNRRIIEALEEAVRLNPMNVEAHIQLAREYVHLWNQTYSVTKWMPASDLSMERAAFFAGEINPFIHYSMGDYWLMRSKTVTPASSTWEAMMAKARWHFQKNLQLEKGDDRKRMLEQIRKNIWVHYPDAEFVKRMIEE
ncbi:MAG: hypothetical protein C4576_31645 [Desulfobacteraceae bacterium]|nr:MAG: hypothetical protein C4576_31645 [Desulfobacteraceae bacterium]